MMTFMKNKATKTNGTGKLSKQGKVEKQGETGRYNSRLEKPSVKGFIYAHP